LLRRCNHAGGVAVLGGVARPVRRGRQSALAALLLVAFLLALRLCDVLAAEEEASMVVRRRSAEPVALPRTRAAA
jgi:hypothetical protein